MCDALAEELSIALCRFYFQEFGCLLHHNVDKALLWGGSARPAFGGGEILAPMEIFLAGRATTKFQGVEVPVAELAATSCRDWLRRHFHALNPEKHVKLHCLVRPGSADLAELYARAAATGIWLANDTSCGVGYAPLSPLERVVYEVERQLNSPVIKESYPEIGEDIKVMGIRRDGAIYLTLGCAFIDRYLDSPDDYCQKKTRLEARVKEIARQVTELPVNVAVNTADDPEHGSFYLTVTGTSAEAGDDGQVGRGNRANGLISPYRPMTLEASAGKNPITHVGKLYNIAANQIAGKIVAEIPEVTAAYCYLVSQIGKPVREPQLIDLQVQTAAGLPVEPLRQTVEAIAGEILAGMDTLWQRLVAGEFLIY
jgi:S-adenosylmethionine synthetase